MNIIFYRLYLLLLQFECSRLCVYKYDESGRSLHYCSNAVEFCSASRYFNHSNNDTTTLYSLFGYQSFDDVESCESYINKEDEYVIGCSYKCNGMEKEVINFCVDSGNVCPLGTTKCPMFHIPQLYNNITECNANIIGNNSNVSLVEPVTELNAFTAYKFTNTTRIEFGIETCSDDYCVSDLNNPIHLSLLTTNIMYQCHIFPIETHRWYTCDSYDMYTTECNYNLLNEYEDGIYLLVNNDGDNGMHFDRVMLNIQDIKTNYTIMIDEFIMDSEDYIQLKEAVFTDYQTGIHAYDSIPVSTTNILIHIDAESIIDHEANIYVIPNQTSSCIEDTENKFIYVNEKKTWLEAEKYCSEEFGSHLATITSDDDMWITRQLTGPGREAWIGMNDREKEGFWIYADGTTCGGGSCVNDPRWAEGEPNNYNISKDGEDCAHISHDVDGYNDKNCDTLQPFICNWGMSIEQKWSDWMIVAICGGVLIVITVIIICSVQQKSLRKLKNEIEHLKYEKSQTSTCQSSVQFENEHHENSESIIGTITQNSEELQLV